MIEQLFPGGGGDEKAAVSSNDTTPGYLNGKLVAGTGIGFTENNNGGNETLTIASTIVNTDEVAKVSSNDTTAGYLNGKLVAGSGIALTENNNGGNETLGISVANIDANAITTGTIATARLGTGTASSSTYLRGDQTWAAISAGPTFYTVTANDVENTAAEITAISFTVPANTWTSGQAVVIEWMAEMNNGTGTNLSDVTVKFGGTSVTESAFTNVAFNTTTGFTAVKWHRLWLIRDGNGLVYSSARPSSPSNFAVNSLIGTQFIGNNIGFEFGTHILTDTSVDYANPITFYLRYKFATASPNLWIRHRFVSAYKIDGTV